MAIRPIGELTSGDYWSRYCSDDYWTGEKDGSGDVNDQATSYCVVTSRRVDSDCIDVSDVMTAAGIDLTWWTSGELTDDELAMLAATMKKPANDKLRQKKRVTACGRGKWRLVRGV